MLSRVGLHCETWHDGDHDVVAVVVVVVVVVVTTVGWANRADADSAVVKSHQRAAAKRVS